MGWKDCETRSATKERWNERKFEGKTARKNERRKQTMHHGMNDLFSEWMNEWMNEWMIEWMKEGMKEWRNEGMNEKKCTCKPAWQERRNKSTDMRGMLTMVTTPRCSTPRCSTPRCSGVACFLHFVMWNRALATTPCTFSTFHNFQKSVERLRLYIIVWNAKQALAIQSCVFVSPTTFLDGGPHLRKQRPSFGDHGSHFTRKTQGFVPRVLFTRECSCVRFYDNRPWYDDMMMMKKMMMMMMTTPDKTALWHSAVTRKFVT